MSIGVNDANRKGLEKLSSSKLENGWRVDFNVGLATDSNGHITGIQLTDGKIKHGTEVDTVAATSKLKNWADEYDKRADRLEKEGKFAEADMARQAAYNYRTIAQKAEEMGLSSVVYHAIKDKHGQVIADQAKLGHEGQILNLTRLKQGSNEAYDLSKKSAVQILNALHDSGKMDEEQYQARMKDLEGLKDDAAVTMRLSKNADGTVSVGEILRGVKYREDTSSKVDDSTKATHGTHIDSWRGGVLTIKDGDSSTSYYIKGAESFSYDKETGRFEVHGARVVDKKSGLTYIADFAGTGQVVGDATNPMGIKTSYDQLAIEKFQNAHSPQVPVFNLTPEKALNLAEDRPDALEENLIKYKDNPLLARAYNREFSINLARGIAAQYGKLGHKEDVGHEESERKSWVSSIMTSISSRLGWKGDEGAGGSGSIEGQTGLRYDKSTTDKHGQTASWDTEVMAAAVNKTLNEAVDTAREEENDMYIMAAVDRVHSAVEEAEKKAEMGIEAREKLERKEGNVDLQGVTDTEKLTGEKIKMSRPEPIDVRGGNAGDQLPYHYVTPEQYDQIMKDWDKYSDEHDVQSRRDVGNFVKQYDLTMEQRAAVISEIVHRSGIGKPNSSYEEKPAITPGPPRG